MISERSSLSLALLVVGVGLFVHTYTLGFADLGGAFSPVFFPRIILAAWILLAVISLIIDVVTKPVAAYSRWLIVALTVLTLFAYIYSLQLLGFFISSVLFCAVSLIINGQRKPLDIILFCVLVPGTLVLLFNHMLTMPLPVSPFFWWI